MNILEAFRVALSALATNKLRALLTMLGIIIGISSVIGMQSIGNGFRNYLQKEYARLGVGVFYIMPEVASADTTETQIPQLTSADAAALMQPGAAPAVAAIAIEYSVGGSVVSGGKDSYWYTAQGVTPNIFTVSENELGAGRYFTDNEERDRARVAVIGNKVADTLFGGVSGAIGKRITVDSVGFDVVGVLTTKPNGASGDNFFNGPGDTIYLPYQTARARLFRNQLFARQDVSRLTVKARSQDQVDAAIKQVTDLLRQRHRLTYQSNDFRINNPEQAAKQSQRGLAGFSAFLVIIGGIALLVGGIGIMNIMLVSVTQRTREIGLRKAVGARRRDILMQFLIEALVLCMIGGAIGIAIGFSLSFLGTLVIVSVFRLEGGQAVVDLNSVVMATVISVLIGLFFGFWPAWRAARLQPVQALRSE